MSSLPTMSIAKSPPVPLNSSCPVRSNANLSVCKMCRLYGSINLTSGFMVSKFYFFGGIFSLLANKGGEIYILSTIFISLCLNFFNQEAVCH